MGYVGSRILPSQGLTRKSKKQGHYQVVTDNLFKSSRKPILGFKRHYSSPSFWGRFFWELSGIRWGLREKNDSQEITEKNFQMEEMKMRKQAQAKINTTISAVKETVTSVFFLIGISGVHGIRKPGKNKK